MVSEMDRELKKKKNYRKKFEDRRGYEMIQLFIEEWAEKMALRPGFSKQLFKKNIVFSETC